jgi:2-(1,2-epoxy-1,2-dihydrophenyl)acetyl-CoA isomerase
MTAGMAFQTILFDVQDGVARLTLNRPDRLNAMTWQMIDEFLEAIETCRTDDRIRVLVFTGAGRAFSAGDDIVGGMGDRRQGGNPGGINNDRGLHYVLVKNLLELPKPVVAALNGRCHGAGFVLALACDFRVGHTETLVGDIRSGRAIFAGQSVPLLLPRLIGQSRAMDLLITGRVIDGTEAERIGLLNRLWQPSTYEADLAGFVSELANGPTLTYAAWKLTVNRSVLLELDGYTDYERQLANLVRNTEDHTEGRVSFREKRPARYVGR